VIPVRQAAAVALALVALAGCAGPSVPASFDPAEPCNGAPEQQMAGAYPDLEATVPTALDGVAPTGRGSGRYCSAETLGKLFDAGIGEVRFGAATWDRGSGKGLSLVMYEAAGLTAQAVYDSFLAGAQANAKTHDLSTKAMTVAGLPALRFDFLNGDSSFQRVVVWPGDRSGRVRILLAADQLDSEIQAAADAFR
jgi:outer membrane murein-binding lipoprotein Lpp